MLCFKREAEGNFELFFRRHPFNGSYTVCAGLEAVIDLIKSFKFEGEDLEYLAGLKGSDDQPLLHADFLTYLKDVRFTGSVDAVPEGTLVFPNQALLRIQGPMLQCQILETALLNSINFQSLIATKASRICTAAQGDPVLEFGLRRAQGVDGGVSASRASYIGGCAATSNLLAGKLFGIPVKGTHAHSWVMFYEDEETAFRKYSEALPNNCIFLIDTYNTVRGGESRSKGSQRTSEKGI